MFRDFQDEFFSSDTGGLPGNFLGHSHGSRQRQSPQGRSAGNELTLWADPFASRSLMPFGGGLFGGTLFGGFDSMFESMRREMESDPNVHSYSSSSVMTFSSDGGGGRPRVYRASSSTRAGPGGLKEVKKSVMDSESGLKKAAIEHHIGDRSRTVERSYNTRTNEAAEHERLTNLDEGDAAIFDQEWMRRTKPLNEKAVGYLTAPRQAERHPALPTSKTRRLPPIQVEKRPTAVTSGGHDCLPKGQDGPLEEGGRARSEMPKVTPTTQASDQVVSKSRSKHGSSVGASRSATAGLDKVQNVAARGQGGVEKKVKFVG